MPLPAHRETDADGLVLVDTGLGTADLREPDRALGADWVAYARAVPDPRESALHQVVRLGYEAQDVRHIVPTHLHRDHTGGLADFPHARVHVHPDEVTVFSAHDSWEYARVDAVNGPSHGGR
ncbi:MBL fold metallo-hydrolase [Streptomyces erythrochromogenes]|uniref:MBL fold metallo-hydrolase n=1 Tax=Streptomyces erythrochromogenes TaxID=285574 RepID=UPI00380ECCD8